MNHSILRGLLLVAVFGCSNLTSDSDAPVTLEVRPPAGSGISGQVEIGDTALLSGVALNQKGDSVAATFTWRTPDTALVFVDAATGKITGKQAGSARVQGRVGSLISEFVTVAIVPLADSLAIVPPDSARVLTGDTASAPLIAELDTINPTGPLAGRAIVYEIVQLFPTTDSASLNGGLFALTATTGANGQPVSPVFVRKIPGKQHPDSAFVQIRSFRPSGVTIPGSGQQFIVRFDP